MNTTDQNLFIEEDSSYLARDILAYREENSRLNEERQSLEQVFAALEQRFSELEAELELLHFQENKDIAQQQLIFELFQQAPIALCFLSDHGDFIELNKAACAMFNLSAKELVGKNFRKYLTKESRILFIKLMQQLQQTQTPSTSLKYEKMFCLTNELNFTATARRITLNDTPRILLALNEVSLNQTTIESMGLANTIIDQIREGLLITDQQGIIIKVNHAFTEITGYSETDAIGQRPSLLNSGRHSDGFYQDMWTEINHHGWWAGEIWNKRKSGEIFPEWLQISRIKDELTGKLFYAATFSDITDRKYHQNQLDRMAFYDSLTGLPNRTLLSQTLDLRLSRIKTGEPCQVAVMFLDLDKFKDVNDHYGHAEGDLVLREATQRIVSRIRENDMTARIGGDEFVLVLTRIQTRQDAEKVAKELLDLLAEPFITPKGKHHLSASIGIAFAPNDGKEVEDLMRRADAAMYVAKNNGRNHFHVFKPEQEDKLIESNAMLKLVREAIADPQKHIQMHYQPIYLSQNIAQPVHYEALIRLIDHQGKLIYPGLFIELAEQHGLIGSLGMALFKKVCMDIAESALDDNIKVAVNLSPLQFYIENLVRQLAQIANASGLNLSRFYFEITETATMHNLPLMLDVLAQLRQQNAKIMLDDFGTGYASLSMLKNIPVNVLKIDQGFVKELGDSSQTESLVKAMIGMAKALELNTVAEGVETQAQADWLIQHGADHLQGYLLGRPKPAFLT
ncbi:EAL domain-containing protein [Thiomicrospira microaerophila]|uniref:EAL domain-containing protein n=1 Tax=Thiomicrospira microaerophila TaxID=406020 RepID=UPI000697AA22|nr:EAL domain-containing protein [Thiomicrospira microaerophila]